MSSRSRSNSRGANGFQPRYAYYHLLSLRRSIPPFGLSGPLAMRTSLNVAGRVGGSGSNSVPSSQPSALNGQPSSSAGGGPPSDSSFAIYFASVFARKHCVWEHWWLLRSDQGRADRPVLWQLLRFLATTLSAPPLFLDCYLLY